MEFDDFKWLVVVIVILVVGGIIYGVVSFEQSKGMHYLTICSEEADSFNLKITKIGGGVVFQGDVTLPFTMYLEDGNYLLESWRNVNGTYQGYSTMTTLDRDKNVWMLI